MSWRSTMDITAADARKLILIKVLELSDDRLGETLDPMLYEGSYSFRVVGEYKPLDSRESGSPYSYDTDGGGL